MEIVTPTNDYWIADLVCNMRYAQDETNGHLLGRHPRAAPLAFEPPIRTDRFASAITRMATLKEGDYSVALNDEVPLSIRLERKTLGDYLTVNDTV